MDKPAGFLPLLHQEETFQVTLAEATAPTPDLLLTEVMAATKDLAKTVDDDVLKKLYHGRPASNATITTKPATRRTY